MTLKPIEMLLKAIPVAVQPNAGTSLFGPPWLRRTFPRLTLLGDLQTLSLSAGLPIVIVSLCLLFKSGMVVQFHLSQLWLGRPCVKARNAHHNIS